MSKATGINEVMRRRGKPIKKGKQIGSGKIETLTGVANKPKRRKKALNEIPNKKICLIFSLLSALSENN